MSAVQPDVAGAATDSIDLFAELMAAGTTDGAPDTAAAAVRKRPRGSCGANGDAGAATPREPTRRALFPDAADARDQLRRPHAGVRTPAPPFLSRLAQRCSGRHALCRRPCASLCTIAPIMLACPRNAAALLSDEAEQPQRKRRMLDSCAC